MVNPALIVIFGASGDLAYRKLMPAFYSLCADNHMPKDYAILGTARSEYSDNDFREYINRGIQEHARLSGDLNAEAWQRFSSRIFYSSLPAYDSPDGYHQLKARIEELDKTHNLNGKILFYLSTPPSLYGTIPEMLGEVGLNRGDGWRRVIVEKPFGTDLKTAQDLNTRLHDIFSEDQIYRIDHYLGKETVQNLLVFRFANALFEPIWNRNYIDHVQISALESVDVGDRAGYYDDSGVLRDMFQNHIMQLLTLSTMEAPVALEDDALRDEKVKVLRSIEMIEPSQVGVRTIRGQYNGYLNENGVPENSETPTYAALQVFINNWRWQGVPFYLRSGKALKAKSTEIVVQFHTPPMQFFSQGNGEIPPPNRLGICLQPDEGFHLRIDVKQPGAGFKTQPVEWTFHFDEAFGDTSLPEAYERLLLDAIQGDASLFARNDEIEWSWRFIDKIVEGWNSPAAPPMTHYDSGEWGPPEADELLRKAGREWQYGCHYE